MEKKFPTKSEIYSIIRCVGNNADDCIRKQIESDPVGMYEVRSIGGTNKDQIIWFSDSHDNFGKQITEEHLLSKLQELGKNRVFFNSQIKNNLLQNVSGTIFC